MAEAVLSPLLEVIVEKLVSKFTDDVQLLRGVRKEIEKLSNTLGRIQACIHDAEEREVTEKAVQLWLNQLKDVTYDADDIIDEFATEFLMEDEISTPENQVCCFSPPCLCLKQVPLRHKIGKRIREIREKIDKIVEEGSKFKLREGVTERRIGTGERQETDSSVIESEIYGRDKDRIAIVDMLLDHGSDTLEVEDLSVISVVGLGGLGKTTLAKLAYNEEQVGKHFEIKIWVCVSDDFDVKRLIKAIIESITKQQPSVSEMDPLHFHLKELLKQRRYLLVLDDVWNEDVEKWNCMKTLLRSCGGEGSKIMVTTRSEKVAKIMGKISYPLGVLSNDDCWTLFKERAFGGETENAYPNLVQIGKEIVRKCKGVPLAAKALGSLVFFQREENDWLFVRDCEIWNLPENQNNILPALSVSYNHLPAHLKQSFAYCSIFPKDYNIEKKTLIRQWIAEGYIQSSNGCRTAEDVGNEYFNNLLWRSFFQDIEKDEFGNIRHCKMHDLIHDLAQSITRDSCLILDMNNDQQIIPKQARHLSLLGGRNDILPPSLHEAKSLRTFFSLDGVHHHFPSAALDKMILSLKSLRVLTICSYQVMELPTSIGHLILLRYFDISETKVKKLPRSITNLKNLQTLKLGFLFKELPQDLCCLKNLRHLDIARCGSLTFMPSKIGELSFLQTLPIFIVSKDNRCGIGELNSLYLRGFIYIKNLENVENGAEARSANLKDKRNLQELYLLWSNNTTIKNIENVLEGLQPHRNLKRLVLQNYTGVCFSSWLMNIMLSNLFEVRLYNCRNCDLLPPFGSLPSLKFLSLEDMDGVKYLNIEFDKSCTVKGFLSLKKLYLLRMPNLEELTHTHGNDLFPCLEELKIRQCPKLTSFPRLPSLKELQLDNSSSIILNSVPSLTSLSSLNIGFEELKFLPEGMLQPLNLLQSLKINNCQELRSLECLFEESHYLTSLKSLKIYGCNSLTSFPDKAMQGLIVLEELSIIECHKLTCLPSGFRHLTSLKWLVLWTLPRVNALPEDLQHLTNLKFFALGHCGSFTSLPEWLGNMTSLQSLEIRALENVKSLPMGMQHLSSLRDLTISGCLHLKERCRKDTGEDWYKIQHIPNVHISS